MASQQEQPRRLTVNDIKRRKDRLQELEEMSDEAADIFYKELNNGDYEHHESQAMFAKIVQEIHEMGGREKYEVRAQSFYRSI
jgi:hypothetical protein